MWIRAEIKRAVHGRSYPSQLLEGGPRHDDPFSIPFLTEIILALCVIFVQGQFASTYEKNRHRARDESVKE
jgi:hypothetical protein